MNPTIQTNNIATGHAALKILEAAAENILLLHVEVCANVVELKTRKEKLSFLKERKEEVCHRILTLKPIVLAFSEGNRASADKFMAVFESVLSGIEERIATIEKDGLRGNSASDNSTLNEEKLRTIVEEAISSAQTNRAELSSSEKLMRRKDVSDELKISLKTVSEWMKAGKLPYHRINSRIFFKRSEIMTAMVTPVKYIRKS